MQNDSVHFVAFWRKVDDFFSNIWRVNMLCELVVGVWVKLLASRVNDAVIELFRLLRSWRSCWRSWWSCCRSRWSCGIWLWNCETSWRVYGTCWRSYRNRSVNNDKIVEFNFWYLKKCCVFVLTQVIKRKKQTKTTAWHSFKSFSWKVLTVADNVGENQHQLDFEIRNQKLLLSEKSSEEISQCWVKSMKHLLWMLPTEKIHKAGVLFEKLSFHTSFSQTIIISNQWPVCVFLGCGSLVSP